jgi:hypothetical protein
MSEQQNKRKSTRNLSYILLGFSVLFLVTALVLDSDVGVLAREELPGSGGLVGPVRIGENNSVVEVQIAQYLTRNRQWSFITGELLDSNKRYLTGFGDELWYEEGRDSEGRWVESDRNFEDKLTIRKRGQYYFKFNVESNASPDRLPNIRVEIAKKMASSVPHFAGGIILLIVGVILNIKGGGLLASLFSDDD